ncbi:MAG: hypothetical protein U1E60_27945 [Reyranellaceae bacterium]
MFVGLAPWCLGFLSLALPTAVVAAYTLNLFYRTGTFFWDPGLFVHLGSFSDSWPMLWPDFLHRDLNAPRQTFFSIHFMPFLYVTSALYKLVAFMPPAAYFSVLQGLWSGLIGLSVFILCTRRGGTVLAVAAALPTALCGPVLGASGFPHIEPAIPALFLLFFALRSAGFVALAYAALALCLSVREDAGLHALSFLSLLAIAQWLSGQPRKVIWNTALTAALCAAYSLFALTFPWLWYPRAVSLLHQIYLGNPALAHVSWAMIGERLIAYLTDRAYITWPLLVLLGVAMWRRSPALAVGVVAPLPWMLLALIAIRGEGLWGYYSFPLIVSIAWPAVVLGAAGARLLLGLSTLSIALFVVMGGPNPDRTPWRSLQVPDLAVVGHYERLLIDAVGRRDELGRLAVDDSVVTLISNSLKIDEWVIQWVVDKLPNPDTVIFNESVEGPLDTRAAVEAAIKASGLTHKCRLGDTPFVVASRNKTSLCP